MLIKSYSLLLISAATFGAAWPAPLMPTPNQKRDSYTLNILHVNDVHSHLVPFDPGTGLECPLEETPSLSSQSAGLGIRSPSEGDLEGDPEGESCVGGWGRIAGEVGRRRDSDPDRTIFLNSGDDAQGTWFWKEYGFKIIPEYLNLVKPVAWTPGNHDFDGGEDNLTKGIGQFEFPALAANIEPATDLKKRLKPYVVLEEHKLVIIGLSTVDTKGRSKAHPNTKFNDPIRTAQKLVKKIREKYPKEYRIIALSHIGYELDQRLAKETTDISVIVGGHSHTGLGGMIGHTGRSEGPYPTMVKKKNGDDVCVLQAAMFGRYLGAFTATWKDDNKLEGCTSKWVELDNKIKPDPKMNDLIKPLFDPLAKIAFKVVGHAANDITMGDPYNGKSLMGNFLADVMLEASQNSAQKDGMKADFAFSTSGSIRFGIPKGKITAGRVNLIEPFGNLVVNWKMKGKDIWKMLEGVYSLQNQYVDGIEGKMHRSFLHYSKGVQVKYDRSSDSKDGLRLKELNINGINVREDENMDKEFTFATSSWVMHGKESILLGLKEKEWNKEPNVVGRMDTAILKYLKEHDPVEVDDEDRIEGKNRESVS
ncbi:Uu.00g138960.m01.CDS01 [Anthostomella pinea]|uniref:Uu.00g138960.m01.CDS01 n=1 Tax=Anthostomella pinea TaxID=933095 RepID=A0AAI8YLD5_9PEZI|nr:Uu.00g138960.m01.CDS01 [Anthostomella pinea]